MVLCVGVCVCVCVLSSILQGSSVRLSRRLGYVSPAPQAAQKDLVIPPVDPEYLYVGLFMYRKWSGLLPM